MHLWHPALTNSGDKSSLNGKKAVQNPYTLSERKTHDKTTCFGYTTADWSCGSLAGWLFR
jgi:hypothetical protein